MASPCPDLGQGSSLREHRRGQGMPEQMRALVRRIDSCAHEGTRHERTHGARVGKADQRCLLTNASPSAGAIGVVAGSRVRRTCGRGRAERGVSLAGNLPSYVAYGAIFVRPLIFGDAPSHREETGFVRHERTRHAGDYISRCETVVVSFRIPT
jgi:hypothetical protein